MNKKRMILFYILILLCKILSEKYMKFKWFIYISFKILVKMKLFRLIIMMNLIGKFGWR